MIFFIFLASFFILVHCQSIQPPAIPLAVRSPYLQAFLPHTTSANNTNNWPSFWTTSHIVGWCGLVRVDGALYSWMGNPVGLTLNNNATFKPVTFQGYQITPTRSILSLQAGPMAINVTFLSPIEPTDLVKQSFPFTYIYFEASSTDENSHSVQVYQDISGEWTSSDTNNVIQWNTTTSSNPIIFHEAQRDPYQYMIETNNIAEDGVVYHVTNSGASVTYQTGQDIVLRSGFLNYGKLNKTQDTNYRAISSDWPVFAFASDLGSISSTPSPVVWGIGLVRQNDIIYSTTSGNQTRQQYFFTEYSDVSTAMSAFMSDASTALQRATTLDNKIVSDASLISSNYADLVSLASRQAMAGIEITVGTSNGKVNNSDIMFFMKDLGNSQRANPVEVLYAAFPAILYLNASWAGYLLEPLLQFEQSGLYSQAFAADDLGDAFPAVVGNTAPSVLTAMESSSDMLIMAWAHATFSGDGTLISQYYSTLKKWTDTLISENPLTPNSFISADGLSSANMTNLAIKGIIAIRTMAEISKTLGFTSDYNSYSGNASSLVSQWQNVAGSSGHLTSTYGASTSWAMIYNLYPDKLFGFNLVNDSIYTEQTNYYSNAVSSAASFGLPYDSNESGTAKSQWTLFTAGTVTDSSVRNSLVSMVYESASNLKNFTVFPTTYSTSDGSTQGGGASPAQGAMFALLALNLTKHTITGSSTGSSAGSNPLNNSSTSHSHAGAIAGGVVGGIAFIALLALAVFFFRRSRSRRGISDYSEKESGGFAMLFRPRRPRNSPSQEPLDGYYVEPIGPYTSSSLAQSRGYTSTDPPSSHPTSSNGESHDYAAGVAPQPASSNSSNQDSNRVPLRLHNGDGEQAPRRQAPPLPRKGSSNPPLPPGAARHRPPSSSVTASSTTGLREEVENLRRQMEEMRSRNAYEPPPEYQ
jgi:hypothetical protein